MNDTGENIKRSDISWDNEFEYCKRLYDDIIEKEEKDRKDIGSALMIMDITMHQFIRAQVNADKVDVLKGYIKELSSYIPAIESL